MHKRDRALILSNDADDLGSPDGCDVTARRARWQRCTFIGALDTLPVAELPRESTFYRAQAGA